MKTKVKTTKAKQAGRKKLRIGKIPSQVRQQRLISLPKISSAITAKSQEPAPQPKGQTIRRPRQMWD